MMRKWTGNECMTMLIASLGHSKETEEIKELVSIIHFTIICYNFHLFSICRLMSVAVSLNLL